MKITDKVLKVRPSDTVAEIKNLIETQIKDFETIDYIYVLDTNSTLAGVLSIKELFLSNNNEKVSDLAKKTPLVIATKACISALFSGLRVPYVFRQFNVDHANASGPIGTIIQDILSVAIYFIIASILM